MNKSISSRFFRASALLLLASVLFLGLFLLYFSTNYFRTESESKLLGTIQNVSDLFLLYSDDSAQLENAPNINQIVSIVAKSTDCLLFITDSDGVVRTSLSDEMPLASPASPVVNGRILSRALIEGSYTELGNLDGFYLGKFYTACMPLNNAAGELIGYVFASQDASDLTSFLRDLTSLFIMAAAVMLIVSSILSAFLSGRITEPIRKINDAAQSFGNGDFSARVEVEASGELGQLAETFNTMATKLEAIDSSRQSFMGSIAHELRTPMTTIKGFVDGMLDGTIPQQKWDYYLSIVSQEAGRLTRLTRSMLDITKLETGEYVVAAEDYDVWETISNIMFSREQQFIEHAIRLTGFNPQKTWVHADPDLVHQVLYNIVDNAIKFTPDNGTIEIGVEGPRQGFVTISITNTGDGIPEDTLPYVFDRFYKADRSRGLHAQGSGLGLHLCKQFINRSGGKIWVESKQGESTTFAFTLPAGKPPEKSRGKTASAKGN